MPPGPIISSGMTRTGVVRTNATDWRALRDNWDDLGYGQILSTENRAAIAKGRTPKVDDAWVKVFPEDAGLKGEEFLCAISKVRHLRYHYLIYGIWMRICQEGLDIIRVALGQLFRHTHRKKELSNAFHTARACEAKVNFLRGSGFGSVH